MDTRPYVSIQEIKQRVPIPEALAKLGLGERFTRKGDVLTGVNSDLVVALLRLLKSRRGRD